MASALERMIMKPGLMLAWVKRSRQRLCDEAQNLLKQMPRGWRPQPIKKVMLRPWLMTFAVLISFSFRLDSDQSLIGPASPACQRAQEIAEM
jgi:hypothetical protein